MHVVGTAGHVDHGKSSLVRALTGTDPDRWIEEKLRGMTLDLGFAHLRYEDGVEAGIVDVPGHERFVHNMLAGAAGMELLLLVVAANEGPRPQTLEHLAILRYLNVRGAIVVLTKADLVDAEELAIARELVAEATRGGPAEGAPAIAVSTVTGAGLEELRAAIHAALLALPPRPLDAPAYLPIDRVFSLAGHGTIVTGTLMQGRIRSGAHLRLQPGDRDVRVRSVHAFHERRDEVAGGARVALNLPGIETSSLARGDVLTEPGIAADREFAVRFLPLPDVARTLRRRTPVRAHIGSAEILGTLVFSGTPQAGEQSARLTLRAPAVAFTGAPFVLRRMSPKELVGGGTFLASGPAGAEVANVEAVSEDDADAVADPHLERVAAALRDAGLGGTTPSGIGASLNLRAERVQEMLETLLADGRALRLTKPAAFVGRDLVAELGERALVLLREGEAKTPWALGMTALALSRGLNVPEPQLTRVLVALADEGTLVHRAGYYATVDFTPRLTAEQLQFFETAFAGVAANPTLPVSFAEVVARIKASRVPGLSLAFDTLLAGGALIKVHEDLYRASQIDRIRADLEATLRARSRITMAEFRDVAATSRKHAVPLLEWFDAAGVTVRSGDYRTLRKTSR